MREHVVYHVYNKLFLLSLKSYKNSFHYCYYFYSRSVVALFYTPGRNQHLTGMGFVFNNMI